MNVPMRASFSGAAALTMLLASVASPEPARAQESQPELPHYVSHPVPAPAADAPYLLPDKQIYILSNDLVGPYFEALDAVFIKTHPNIKIHLNALGSEPALAALTSNISAFTPLGRDGIRQDLAGFKALHGFEPQSFLVGYDQSPDPDIFPPGKVPSAVWINVKNPLPKITLALAARIFTNGASGGQITHWSQLGVKGEWARREIHVYLPAKRDSAFLFIDGTLMGGRPWSPHVEWVDSSTDVMTAVAEDPYGIGIVGFWPPDSGWDRQSDLASQAKLLPMAVDEEAHYSHATVGDVYPTTGSIRVYFNAAPGKPLEPWMREYMRLVLSKEGQDILKSLAAENGYIPLEPSKVLEELAKLK